MVAEQHEDDICVWIGAAGYSGASAQWIRGIFQQPLLDLAALGKHCEMFIANDAVALLKSPPVFSKGLAAIVGTGSVVMGVHPSCRTGVVKRGGWEWLVSDEGSGSWMTLQGIRYLLQDMQDQGAIDYQSPLLDRLCDYFGVEAEFLSDIPPSHRSMARAELLAQVVSEGRLDAKRRIAGFVYPHLFDLATMRVGYVHDKIAARVLSESVRIIAGWGDRVSEELAANTADNKNEREKLPLVIAGNIASHPIYLHQLTAAISECPYISEFKTVGDASDVYAELAVHYLESRAAEQRAIARNLDPVHTVTKLM